MNLAQQEDDCTGRPRTYGTQAANKQLCGGSKFGVSHRSDADREGQRKAISLAEKEQNFCASKNRVPTTTGRGKGTRIRETSEFVGRRCWLGTAARNISGTDDYGKKHSEER